MNSFWDKIGVVRTDDVESEAEVRALRDKVYGTPISDKEWGNCKGNWMEPQEVKWLREHTNPVAQSGVKPPQSKTRSVNG
jgi:hypothetical protein